MPAWRLYPLIALFLTGCASAPVPDPPDAAAAPHLLLAGWSGDGNRILGVQRTRSECRLVVRDLVGAGESVHDLGFCPSSMRVVRDGSLLLKAGGESTLLTPDGERIRGVVDALDSERLLRRDTTGLIWPDGTRSEGALGARDFRLLPDAASAVAITREIDGERLVRLDAGGEVAVLAGPFAAIDSFDLSPDGVEAVLSARRDDNFDVALASTAGGEVNWIGPDPLDETMVSWAPRGSKVTYKIEAPMGSVLRSVHVPTGFQRSFSWPGTLVRGLSWQPLAEKFVVLAESPAWPPHARIADYAGDAWNPLFGDAVPVAGDPEPAAALRNTWVWAPRDLRYGESVPLIVWLEGGELWEWNGVRADLQQNLRIGTAVLGRGTEQPGWLKALLSELRWADPGQVFVVTAGSSRVAPGGTDRAVILAPPGDERFEWAAELVELSSGEPELEAAQWLVRRLQEAKREE
ncbi:MAG: hypothetical protein ABR517_05270 [Thermoanaerobaculia bacterium]